MSAFERLTAEDKDMILDYINTYGSIDAGYLHIRASLDHILRFWNKNKEDLFCLFGGETILSREISISKPLPMLEDEISSQIYGWGQPANQFYKEFDKFARTVGTNLETGNYTNLRYDLSNLMNTETLARNIYSRDPFTIETPDGHKIEVATGCKVSKVLGKIAKAFNLEHYEEFRIAHSMCLNQKKLKGKLCLSIHPLDYMTMSDNNCGWDSCMSWQAPGDYRLGTVEMMNSPYVVVAYLCASEDMALCEDWNWNSKKWRQLFIVTPHIITGIRQYPYNSDELNATVLNWLRDLAEKNGAWGPYSTTMSKVRNYNDNVFADIDCHSYLEFSTHFMYNDFYAEHNSYVAPTIPEKYSLCFSGETECMSCGEDISHYDDSMTDACCLTCNSCEHVYYCSECGNRVDEDDCVFVDGYRVCSYCYEEHWRECRVCEEMHNENDMYTIYLADAEGEPTSYSIEVCYRCVNTDKFNRLFGATREVEYRRWDTRTVVDLANITKDGLDYFEVWHGSDLEEFEAYLRARDGEEN